MNELLNLKPQSSNKCKQTMKTAETPGSVSDIFCFIFLHKNAEDVKMK